MTEPALLRMALGMIFVILLILVCAWLARRSGLLQRHRSPLTRQIDQLLLGPRASIAVVEIQNTWLVVGVTPNQITPLHTLPAGTLPPVGSTAFPNLLSRILGSADARVGQPRTS